MRVCYVECAALHSNLRLCNSPFVQHWRRFSRWFEAALNTAFNHILSTLSRSCVFIEQESMNVWWRTCAWRGNYTILRSKWSSTDRTSMTSMKKGDVSLQRWRQSHDWGNDCHLSRKVVDNCALEWSEVCCAQTASTGNSDEIMTWPQWRHRCGIFGVLSYLDLELQYQILQHGVKLWFSVLKVLISEPGRRPWQ